MYSYIRKLETRNQKVLPKCARVCRKRDHRFYFWPKRSWWWCELRIRNEALFVYRRACLPVETRSICVCSVRTTWMNSTLLWITEKTEETLSESSGGCLMVKGSKIAYGRGLFVLQRLCVMVLIWALLSALEFCFQSWWGTLMPQEGEQVCWWEICFKKLWVN